MLARGRWTRQWWDEERFRYQLFTSLVVQQELQQGDYSRKAEKLALMNALPVLEANQEVLNTAAFLVVNKAMPMDPFADAVHLSLASHYDCGILLTWNCVHLAN